MRGHKYRSLIVHSQCCPCDPIRPSGRLTAYTRHGTTCLLAAWLVHQGTTEGRCVDSRTHAEFLSFLKHLYRKYPHKELHVIVDKYSAHKHQKVVEWAAKQRRLTFALHPDLRLMAQPDRNLVQHLHPQRHSRRNLAGQTGTCESDHAVHKTP